MRQSTKICLALAIALSVLPQLEAPVSAQQIKTIWVAHHRVDCIGVGPQKCYLIKDTQYEDWRFWYGEIEGFDFEEGYAYELSVIEERIENPPADASSIQLKLDRVLLKVETFEAPDPGTSPPPPVSVPEPPPAEMEAPLTEPHPDPVPESTPQPLTPAITDSRPPIERPARRPATTSKGETHRGHLTIGSGVEARSFKICGAQESIWVEDRTDGDLWALYRGLSSYANRPLFMEVQGDLEAPPAGGFGANFQQQILIYEVRNATVESAGCFAEPTQFAFRASGNEPFWNVEISKRGLALSEMGQERPTLFPYSPPTFFGDQIIYRSQIRGEVPRTIIIRLRKEPCSDSMADAQSSFSTAVTIDDRSLEGCAREGEEEP